ncbi:MAG TPA: hypothetical protein VJQ84_04155 [Solirubrobacterales bacterium]|nr:hypothetical protein [Solirubrobacterales bacterium]
MTFQVKASNGNSIFGIAFSRRADGRGNVTLFVGHRGAVVTYFAPATVVPSAGQIPSAVHPPSAIRADLGALGRIDLEFAPSGGVKREHSPCGKDTAELEAGAYRGDFEFHGEENYADADVNSVSPSIRLFLSLVCPGRGTGEISGRGLRGARLRLSTRSGNQRLSVQMNQNRPFARMPFEASLHERVKGIGIERTVHGVAPSSSFSFQPDLRTALVSPPAPFSGSAVFRRNASAANRWTGSLSVDFLGRSDVPLAGAGVKATLVPARRMVERRHHRH